MTAEAVEAGLQALRHRDLSAAQLEQRLTTRGFSGTEIEDALRTLRRTGLLDDRRFAILRAASLADRGSGDALIRYDLERAGVADDLVDVTLSSLEAETERARRIVERRGVGPKTARYLGGKGFEAETISALLPDDVVASPSGDELG